MKKETKQKRGKKQTKPKNRRNNGKWGEKRRENDIVQLKDNQNTALVCFNNF